MSPEPEHNIGRLADALRSAALVESQTDWTGYAERVAAIYVESLPPAQPPDTDNGAEALANEDWFAQEVVGYFKVFDHSDIWRDNSARALHRWLIVRAALRATADAQEEPNADD